jgi:hypothetical protein
MIKRLLSITMLLGMFTMPAFADYQMIVAQKPGGGTDTWARIIALELEKTLGERIIVVNFPGREDIPGFNRFHNEFRFDDKTIMVSNGGNAESFLLSPVDYNYSDYNLVALTNLTVLVGKRTDQYVEEKVKFAACSGQNPDSMAITMLVCGPQDEDTMEAYEQCFRDKIIYVPGMGGGVRRKAYLGGELNVTRESPARYKKIQSDYNELWFTHGVLDLDSGKIIDDRNNPGKQFVDVYEARWGVKPSGTFFDAYVLLKNYRDVLQKALWVDKGNPNQAKLEKAVRDMIADPEINKILIEKSGDYDWIIGEADGTRILDILKSQTTEKNLRNLVWWNSTLYGQVPVFKEELLAD